MKSKEYKSADNKIIDQYLDSVIAIGYKGGVQQFVKKELRKFFSGKNPSKCKVCGRYRYVVTLRNYYNQTPAVRYCIECDPLAKKIPFEPKSPRELHPFIARV